MNTIPNSDNGAKIGPELIRLRLNATLKQSKLAERLKVDTSRISRIETGDFVPDEKEVVEIAEAIGSEEAFEYAAYQKKKWTALEKPSFWHPSKNELAMAETHLARIVQFMTKPQTTESAKAQAEFYRTAILAAADYLRPLEHSLAFVGDIGVGKSTAICGLCELLLPGDAKEGIPISRRVVLEAGSGRTTLCEVQLRPEGKSRFGLLVHPHSQEEIFRLVSDFSASMVDALQGGNASRNEGEERGVTEELGKALRNMAGLARRNEKKPDGTVNRIDPAMELARQCNGNLSELTAEILKRIRLEQRTKTEFRFEGDDRATGLHKLRDLFASVNKGLCPDVSLPRRIDITIPRSLLGKRNVKITIIDTKGVDDTAIRPDIRAYLDDPRTVTVLCSRFNSAPDSTMQQLLENLVNTGAERPIAERVILLVLARAQEVLDTQDDAGNRAETSEEGYRIKREQIRWAFSKEKGIKDLPVLFFDLLTDDHKVVGDEIATFIDRMRAAHAKRIQETGQAVDELIKRHGDTQTKEAQEKVRRRLRIFVEQHLNLEPPLTKLHQAFIAAVRQKHARTVWATTRWKGTWQGLDAYHWLGDGTAIDAQARSQPIFFGLGELLQNMLGDEELSPARDYLNELRRTLPVWKEKFLTEATVSGREIFRAELYMDDQVWDDCVRFWGQGSGYRDRVGDRLVKWCEERGHLHKIVEKRVRAAWGEHFLVPLANLCGSQDLLESGGTAPPDTATEPAQAGKEKS
jgi:transcriptional regulator with XRE-family HTH domain